MHLDPNNIVFCVPTDEERSGIQAHLTSAHNPDIHVTGMGSTATAYHVLKLIKDHPHKTIIQLGIAGAFDTKLNPGDLVQVRSESMADFGAEDRDGSMISYFDLLPSVDGDSSPWVDRALVNSSTSLPTLREVTSLTVPFAAGQRTTIERRKDFGCAIENMEGLGLFYTCLNESVGFHSIRAISNYVEIRDKSKWEFERCFRNLAEWLINVVMP